MEKKQYDVPVAELILVRFEEGFLTDSDPQIPSAQEKYDGEY